MVFEGWYAVGDTVVVEPWGVAGVVEEFSLRSTRLRALSGDVVNVHNSQVLAVRRIPRGSREVQIEVYVNDEHAGRALFEDVVRLVPVGPTNFIQPPWVQQRRRHRSRPRPPQRRRVRPAWARVARGRPDPQPPPRARRGALTHGPVVTEVDAAATARFQRATSLSRATGSRAGV